MAKFYLLALLLVLTACEQHKTTPGSSAPANELAPIASSEDAVKPKPAVAHIATKVELSGIAAELETSHPARNAIEQARNSTVFIDTGFGTGSGFFINQSCTIVTNKHVVRLGDSERKKLELDRHALKDYLKRGVSTRHERTKIRQQVEKLDQAVMSYHGSGLAKKIRIALVNGREMYARPILLSEDYDLAYLYLAESGCPALAPSLETSLPLAHKVFTIGNPAGMKYSVTSGIVSGYQAHDDIQFVQTDAAINPGNSGGPLIDTQGRLLGVNTMVLTRAEGIGFALPAYLLMQDWDNSRVERERLLKSNAFKNWQPGEVVKPEVNPQAAVALQALSNCVQEFDQQQWRIAQDECTLAAGYKQPQAQYLLAMLKYQGNTALLKEAVELFELAADGGYAEALYQLSLMHEKGRERVANIPLAIDLQAQACEKSFAPACNSLAIKHYRNYDDQAALRLLRKAVEHGSVLAQFNLGFLHEKGRGIKANNRAALTHYKAAAMLGSSIAQYRLFWFYYKGIAVKKDYQQAYAWLIVSEHTERNESEYIEGWNSDVPTKARFFLKKILSQQQRNQGAASADFLRKKIKTKALQHKKKYLYQRDLKQA